MQLELGKTYRACNGRKVDVLQYDLKVTCFRGRDSGTKGACDLIYNRDGWAQEKKVDPVSMFAYFQYVHASPDSLVELWPVIPDGNPWRVVCWRVPLMGESCTYKIFGDGMEVWSAGCNETKPAYILECEKAKEDAPNIRMQKGEECTCKPPADPMARAGILKVTQRDEDGKETVIYDGEKPREGWTKEDEEGSADNLRNWDAMAEAENKLTLARWRVEALRDQACETARLKRIKLLDDLDAVRNSMAKKPNPGCP